MKTIRIILIVAIFYSFTSCQNLLEDINDDPNKVNKINAKDLFIGIQLANISVHEGYLNWASNIWSGYFVGSSKLAPIQNYQFLNTNSNTPWKNIYQGVVKQSRTLRSDQLKISNKDFFHGTSKILEAHVMSTTANLFGDVPFSEASNDEIVNPKYDKQKTVYEKLQTLLDEAINDLGKSKITGGISEDLFFGGNASKWIKVAYTLKARMYLDIRDYAKSSEAASKGISSKSETMSYKPPARVSSGDINFLNSVLNSNFKGDLAAKGSYLKSLIVTRNHTKTNEASRIAYYYKGDVVNKDEGGIAGVKEPMYQISLQENLLILAETSLRLNRFDDALSKLNEHRKNLREGVYFQNVSSATKYDNYVVADFEKGGIENKNSSLSKEDAC